MDGEIIAAAKRGDQAAWRVLYGMTAPLVRGYYRARRAPDPEDLVGTVFLDAARGIDGFEGNEQQFKAWVFTIAHRRWVDQVRGARRSPTSPLDEVPDTDSGVDVEGDAMREIERESLLRYVDELSPAQRSVVLLEVLGDLSHSEVAQVLGKTDMAVRVNYHRAVNALRIAMESEAAPEPGSAVSRAVEVDVTT